MKKIGYLFREIAQNHIKENLKKIDSIFVVNYAGLSSPDLSALRQSLKNSQANLFVVKNTVARRALKDAGLTELIKSVDGPCGLIFIEENPVATSQVLCNFLREHAQLKLEGGFLKDRPLTKEDIERLAKLPSKDILRLQVVITIKSPISRLATALNQTLQKFVVCLDRIREKKGN